jgi:hypothetical protein
MRLHFGVLEVLVLSSTGFQPSARLGMTSLYHEMRVNIPGLLAEVEDLSWGERHPISPRLNHESTGTLVLLTLVLPSH